MTVRPFALALLVLGAVATGGSVAQAAHRHGGKLHRHLTVHSQPVPRPLLATVAYRGAGVPYTAAVPAPGLDQVGFFSTSFLGDLVLAGTVRPPQPQCIARRAVARETQANPPWASVGATPLYCEIVGP